MFIAGLLLGGAPCGSRKRWVTATLKETVQI